MTPKASRRLPARALAVGLMACALVLLLGTPARAQTFRIDHFKCYITTDQPIDVPVRLQDQFDKAIDPAFFEDVLVRRAVRFCNPVEKTRLDNGQVTPIINPNNHLKLYRMFVDDLDLAPTRRVTIQNQFGKKTIRTFGQEVLAVPTQKLAPIFHPPPQNLDHFKCYRAYGAAVNKLVRLRDQFHVEDNVKVGYPFGFCNPTVKIHGTSTTPITNEEDHLVCYKITRQTFTTTVLTRNQFGEENLVVRAADLLCVPSKKVKVRSQEPV
jgi:hypothetical protein